MRLISVFWISISLTLVASVGADTIIFTDGTFIEGSVTRETTRTLTVSTRLGLRSYDRAVIAEIIKDVAMSGLDAGTDFDQLQPVIKSVLNAQADYDLGHYQRALQRLDPYRDKPQDRAVSIRIDWLMIEISERQGRWIDARKMLEDKTITGTPREKIRAQAHLDLFDDNPDYDLRYIGEKHARNVLKRTSLLQRARKKGALADRELMRLGLEEMCEQMLVQDVNGIKSFATNLDPEVTYEACRNLPGTGDIGRNLPYKDNLRRAEATLAKAQAILGDYGLAFELDLIRTELTHLLLVFNRMWSEVLSASPENFQPASNSRTGRLTSSGRKEWQRRCDEFLELAQPVTRLLEYMVDKVDQYPQGLRDLRALLLDYDERFEHMVKTIKKARGRTRV